MKLIKELVIRGFQGASIGVFLIFTIGILSLISSKQIHYIESPFLIKQYVAGGSVGFVFGCLNLLFAREKFGLLQTTSLHFLGICVIFYPMAYYAQWIGPEALTIVAATFILMTIYIIIWCVCYLAWKQEISEINNSLKQSNTQK